MLVGWTHLFHGQLKWLVHQCPISQSNNHTVDIAACRRSKKWVGLVGVAYWVRLQINPALSRVIKLFVFSNSLVSQNEKTWVLLVLQIRSQRGLRPSQQAWLLISWPWNLYPN